MRLLTEFICQYILDSWKRITENATTTIYSPIKLQTVCLTVICQIHRGDYRWTKKITDEITYKYNFSVGDMLYSPMEILIE
jgi:hypothetical protein